MALWTARLKMRAWTSSKLWPMDQGNLVITFYKWLKNSTPVTSGLDFNQLNLHQNTLTKLMLSPDIVNSGPSRIHKHRLWQKCPDPAAGWWRGLLSQRLAGWQSLATLGHNPWQKRRTAAATMTLCHTHCRTHPIRRTSTRSWTLRTHTNLHWCNQFQRFFNERFWMHIL